MITHIVCFKLKDRSPENIEKARAVLASLAGKIPQLRHLEVGVDLLRTDRSYDLALVAKFDSLDDLNAYQIHLEHQEVIKYMMSVRESAVAVDYEEK
jgi:hypothetical protein